MSALTVLAVVLAISFSGCGSSGQAITIQLIPTGTITIDQGQVVNVMADLSNDTKNLGVTWKFGTSCSGAACGALSNTTTSSTTYTAPSGLSTSQSVQLIATSKANGGVTATLTFSIVLPPTFNTQTLPNGLNSTPYNQTISVTGGVSPLTFSVVGGNGNLPAGLTMNSTGTILGVPTGSSPPDPASTFNVQVVDNGTPPLTVISPFTYTIIINPAPPISVSTTSLPAAIVNVPYSFRVSSLGGIPPFTWSYTGTLPTGFQMDPNTGIISGTATSAIVNKSFSFTAKVTDSKQPTGQTATANLSIGVVNTQPLNITTFSLPQATVATPYSATVQATGGLLPYTWTLASGQLPPGLTLSTQSDGTALIAGTPTLQTDSTFTLQVTDSTNTSLQTNPPLMINVAPISNAQALFSGTYSLLFTGFDADGSVTIIGAVTSTGGGVISAGVNDSNRVSGIFTQNSYTGSYTLGSDGRGTLTLTSTNIRNQQLTTTYQMALRSDGAFAIVENDDTGTFGTGILKPQQLGSFSSSSFSGRYAFGFSGRDVNNAPYAMIGSLSSDGVSQLAPAVLDVNDAGVLSTQLSMVGSFAVASNGLGRGGATFTFKLPSQQQVTTNYSFFFVTNSDILYMSLDLPDATHPRVAGEMLLQQPGQIFNLSALNGASIVSGEGVNFSGQSLGTTAMVGLLQPNGLGSATFSYDQNSNGTVSTPATNNFPTGSYSVNTNGRVSFLNVGQRLVSAYLTGQNAGFFLGGDLATTTGRLENQVSPSPFSATSFNGNYTVASPAPPDNLTVSSTGQINSTGDTNLTGTLDVVPPNGAASTGQVIVGSYSVTPATGRAQMTTSGGSQFPVNLIFYIVSPGVARAIPTDPNNIHPGVILFDH